MRRGLLALLVACALTSVAVVAVVASADAQRAAGPPVGKGNIGACADPESSYPATRDPANPLDLPMPP
jgi:hypothetical protein